MLSQHPGLAASIPLYSEPQELGKFSSLTVIGDSSPIERVFAGQKHPMARSFGASDYRERARVKTGLANLAYNLFRLVWLHARTASA